MIWNQNEVDKDLLTFDPNLYFQIPITECDNNSQPEDDGTSSEMSSHRALNFTWNSEKELYSKLWSSEDMRNTTMSSVKNVYCQNRYARSKLFEPLHSEYIKMHCDQAPWTFISMNTRKRSWVAANESLPATTREERKLQYYIDLIQKAENKDTKKKGEKRAPNYTRKTVKKPKGKRGRKPKNPPAEKSVPKIFNGYTEDEWAKTKFEVVSDGAALDPELFENFYCERNQHLNLNFNENRSENLNKKNNQAAELEYSTSIGTMVPTVTSLLTSNTTGARGKVYELAVNNQASICSLQQPNCDTSNCEPSQKELKDKYIQQLISQTKAMQISQHKPETADIKYEVSVCDSTVKITQHNGSEYSNVRKNSSMAVTTTGDVDMESWEKSDPKVKSLLKDNEMYSQSSTCQGANSSSLPGSPLLTAMPTPKSLPPNPQKVKRRQLKAIFKIVRCS